MTAVLLQTASVERRVVSAAVLVQLSPAGFNLRHELLYLHLRPPFSTPDPQVAMNLVGDQGLKESLRKLLQREGSKLSAVLALGDIRAAVELKMRSTVVGYVYRTEVKLGMSVICLS